MNARVWCDRACHLGEGPIWHEDEQALYWVDILNGQLLRSKDGYPVDVLVDGPQLGGFTIQEDGSLLLFREMGQIVHFFDGAVTEIISSLEGEAGSRFNDVAADPVGRVFCGTMPTGEAPGTLYRLDLDGSIRPVLTGIGCSNGIGFSPDCSTMYYTDSSVKRIYRFQFEADTGVLSDQQVFAQLPEGGGVPDGLTVDAEGFVWSAVWDGSCLLRFAPNGEQVDRIAMPVLRPTCPTFGGPKFDRLHVTSAGGNDRPAMGEMAGATFELLPGVVGRREFRSKVVV